MTIEDPGNTQHPHGTERLCRTEMVRRTEKTRRAEKTRSNEKSGKTGHLLSPATDAVSVTEDGAALNVANPRSRPTWRQSRPAPAPRRSNRRPLVSTKES